ncbi:MAG TPA: hypothetical protein VG101_18965 [Puia sp.]|jgi:hypothetical protein|nr:hypothetical protein [Puia sp.]
MFNQFPIAFCYDGKQYNGQIRPLQTGLHQGLPTSFQVFLNHVYCGLVRRKGVEWETDSPKCAVMVDVIGNYIYERYE